jgi:hypothetical protein
VAELRRKEKFFREGQTGRSRKWTDLHAKILFLAYILIICKDICGGKILVYVLHSHSSSNLCKFFSAHAVVDF